MDTTTSEHRSERAAPPAQSEPFAFGPALQELPDPVWTLDEDLRVVEANEAYCQWVGRAFKWVQDRACLAISGTPEARASLDALLCGRIERLALKICERSGPEASAPGLQVEAWRQASPGPSRILLWGRPSAGTQPAAPAVEAAPAAVATGDGLQHRIVGSLRQALLLVELDGQVRYANDAACRMTGADRDWLEAGAIERLACTEDLPPLGELGVGGWSGESRLRRLDGSEVPVHLSVSPLAAAEENEVQQLVFVARDISDEVRMRRILMQAEKMSALGRMISGVAHELNNPLTTIIGFTQLLLDEEETSASIGSELQRIHGESLRCRSIVENMVKVARQEITSKELLRVEDLLDETLAIREYELGVHDVVIERRYERGLPAVEGNHDQLQQVVLTLVGNAYDALREHGRGGELRVSARHERDLVIIEVEDTGPGITEPEKVFDPFYTTKEVGQGLGLGLSLAYGIVREHRGRILAQNAENGGARFVVELPATRAAAEPALEPDTAAPPRALLVDDETNILELCRRVLVKEGLTVDTAGDGREGLARLAERDYDVIVTDIRMPGGVHGIDLYHWICRNRPRMRHRVVLATGDAADVETQRILKSTGLPYVLKPFALKDLLGKVREILDDDGDAAA